MPDPSPLTDVFYLLLALLAIVGPLGAVAFIIIRSSSPKTKHRRWSSE